MALGKLPNFSDSHLPYVQNWNNNTHLMGLFKDSAGMKTRFLGDSNVPGTELHAEKNKDELDLLPTPKTAGRK